MNKGCAILSLLGMAVVVPLVGCQPAAQEPIKCVCACDQPPPEGTKVTVTAPEAAAAAPATQSAAAAPAPAAPAPAAAAPAARPGPAPSRATGQVGMEPGSGTPVTVSEADKEAMKKAFSEFSNAAGARNLQGMQAWTTKRLGTSLGDAIEKYTDRLYRRTDTFTAGVKAGVTVAEVRDAGEGNFDVEMKFGNGESARVLFFKEEGKWLLNRL